MKKKFYIFLCMLLGVVLLLIIQRSLLALYIILSDNNAIYAVLNDLQLQVINWTSFAIAVVIGLFYGNYLGHHWYPLVYGNPQPAKGTAPSVPSLAPEVRQKSVTIKPVRATPSKVSLKSEIRNQGWDFDDLINHDAPAVESLSGASTPIITTAISIGEEVDEQPKHVTVKKTRTTKSAVAKTVKTSKTAPRKTAAKKTTTKKPAARKPKVS